MTAPKMAIGLILLFLLTSLQYQLWVGDGGIADVWRNKQRLAEMKSQVVQLQERNVSLRAEVKDLKRGLESVEERARNELGMVKDNETFFQVIGEPPRQPLTATATE